jgi:hypothetical protein
MSYEIGVTLLKTNPKNKEARFLIKQTLRDEIEKKKSIKKSRTELDIKIK